MLAQRETTPAPAGGPAPSGGPAGAQSAQPRLLDRVRAAIRARHYSRRTERAYVTWIKRFIFFFRAKRHPADMGAVEVGRFLSALGMSGRLSASSQNQAFSALLFLYREVLGRELTGLRDVVRAKLPVRLPLVLSSRDVASILARLSGALWLMASLMYGAGLRLLECARLRVKDLDFTRGEITVRDGKGRKDRVTMLPSKLAVRLKTHLDHVRRQHESDLSHGHGSVALPGEWPGSTPAPPGNGAGSGSSRPPVSTVTRPPVSGVGTTYTRP